MQLIMRNTIFILLKVVLLILLVSISNYFIDSVIDFNRATENINFLLIYLMQYLFKSWVFLFAVIIYFIVFKKFKERKFLLFKILFAIILSALYAKLFFMDDYSLTIGNFKLLKLFIATSFSSILLLYTELNSKYIRENNK